MYSNLINYEFTDNHCFERLKVEFYGFSSVTIECPQNATFYGSNPSIDQLLLSDDFKVTLYVCPNRIDDGIHSDHSYLGTL